MRLIYLMARRQQPLLPSCFERYPNLRAHEVVLTAPQWRFILKMFCTGGSGPKICLLP